MDARDNRCSKRCDKEDAMLVTLVGLAFLFGLMLKRVGLPPMVGFLLFSIGLKLDFKSLANNEI